MVINYKVFANTRDAKERLHLCTLSESFFMHRNDDKDIYAQ